MALIEGPYYRQAINSGQTAARWIAQGAGHPDRATAYAEVEGIVDQDGEGRATGTPDLQVAGKDGVEVVEGAQAGHRGARGSNARGHPICGAIAGEGAAAKVDGGEALAEE